LMMNVALHGLEEAAGVRYQASGKNAGDTVPGCPVVVRYADDLVACCHSRQQAEQVKTQLAVWLAPRGLVFNEDKTKIVRLTEGFDFLGVNIRRYRNGKLLIKPSSAAVRQLRRRLAAEMRALRGSNAAAVTAALNPVIRGGRPITGEWCPARSSVSWTTTCGSSPGGGPSAPTAASRSGGLPAATSAGSTSSGTTAGCSGTGPAPMSAAVFPTWSSSPGHPSSGTRWSQARHRPTIRTWPATGPLGGSGSNPRWTATTCACSPGRTGAARSAATRY
jgi:hypothetical protein